MRITVLIAGGFISLGVKAQFHPPVGQPGTSAIHKDSTIITAWATGCTVTRGYQNVANTAAGYTTSGHDTSAVGIADGANVVSLGDGGSAIVTFSSSVYNGSGYDFCIFENSFSDNFLELAFVEVSSDGINFFRFPATSHTQDTLQTGSFGFTDATLINNLAGKYRALYGVPFDLQELIGIPGLDIDHITHIKIIDVVGNIESPYATFDQYNHAINDPWPTEFPSGGFDLDAVGVMYMNPENIFESKKPTPLIYPVPCHSILTVEGMNMKDYRPALYATDGRSMPVIVETNTHQMVLHTHELSSGTYILRLTGSQSVYSYSIFKE